MKLLIAIPALNEEDSIESIIQRTLAAREHICKNSFVTSVEVTVVSDGSTDKTMEIAGRYVPQIQLIEFKKNRGYGAAIKEAWKKSNADLLSFLDADGTCDPLFFADLCRELEQKKADVSLGCRINPKSKMPLIRRIGNVIYALLLTLFSSSHVRDTASGMRVVKRSCLPKLMPLPDGLHFTPAMSARAILSKDIKIVEVDMPYEERAGESKLHVIKDGLRFLRVILEAALLYRPGRIMGLTGIGCGIFGALVMVMPVFYYTSYLKLEEWMIYRFVVGSLAGITSCLFICGGYISSRIVDITLSNRVWADRRKNLFGIFLNHKAFWLIPLTFMIIGSAIIFPSIVNYIETGKIYEHWSRFLAMSFLFSIAIVLILTRLIDYALDLVAARVVYLKNLKNSPDAKVYE